VQITYIEEHRQQAEQQYQGDIPVDLTEYQALVARRTDT